MLKPGDVLGEYEIHAQQHLSELGSLYLAHSLEKSRPVSLLVSHAWIAEDPIDGPAFAAAIRRWSKVVRPNVVQGREASIFDRLYVAEMEPLAAC